MTDKQQAIDVIQRLPEAVTLVEVIDKLYLLDRIRVGLAQADADDVVSHEEILREFVDDVDNKDLSA